MQTQNKQIKVSDKTTIKSFTDEIQIDYTPSVQHQKDEIFTLANQFRCAYPPIFADEQQYLPTTAMAQALVIEQQAIESAQDKKTKEDIAKLLLIAAGVFVVIKLLS